MALFKKNQDVEEYEDEELEKKPLRRKVRSRDFKDLNPENRKKRKEPKKRWGRKERLFVLAVLIITFLISGYLSSTSRSWKYPGLPRIDFRFRGFALPFFGEDTIVIEGNKKDLKESEQAIFGFKKITKELSGVYGLYVVNLKSGFSYGVNENEVFEPASLNKLPVMLGLYMEEEAGNLDLDEKYILKNSDKLTGSGSLYQKPSGTKLTYRELIRYMGKESDNTAFNIARNLLGKEKIESVIKSVGMEKTVIYGEKQTTTPKDIGIFFQKLWMGDLINDKSRDELLGFLTDTVYENCLPAGIPPDIRVSHKFGRETHVLNDAGIIYSENPLVVVILSKGIVEKEAFQIFPELARVVYQAEIGTF